MVNPTLNEQIKSTSSEKRLAALIKMIEPHFSPVFGAAKTVEHEVAAIKAFQILGVLTLNPSQFELVTKLRITKAKANSLLYQVELRRSTDDLAWDQRIKNLLLDPVITKDGDYFSISIDNPLLKEVVRERLRSLDIVVDDAKSIDLLRIPAGGVIKLVVSLMSELEKKNTEKKLIEAGITISKTKSLIQGLVQKFGEKFAGEAGEVAGKELAQWIIALFEPEKHGK